MHDDRVAAAGPAYAGADANSSIAAPAFSEWFTKLREARLVELPTPRRVVINLLRACVTALLAVLFYFQLSSAEGLVAVAASAVALIGSALACVRWGVRAVWETVVLVSHRSRGPRWSEPGSRWDDVLGDVLEAGEVGAHVSLKNVDDLIGFALEFLLEATLKPWAMRRKQAQVRRYRELSRQAVDDGEQVLAAWPALMNRRGIASILLLNLNRRGVLVVVTDDRLRCVRLRRQRKLRDTVVNVSLSELRVREWYLGFPPWDVLGPVLWLADPQGTSRLASPWIWNEEATLAFNLVYAAQLSREQPA